MLSLASYFFWTTIAFELFFAIIQAQRELADAGLRSPYGDLSRLSFLPHQEHCDLRSPRTMVAPLYTTESGLLFHAGKILV
jgi:hypothetical protein